MWELRKALLKAQAVKLPAKGHPLRGDIHQPKGKKVRNNNLHTPKGNQILKPGTNILPKSQDTGNANPPQSGQVTELENPPQSGLPQSSNPNPPSSGLSQNRYGDKLE